MAVELESRLGVQSWCFRGLKSHEEVAEALGECGLDRIELSHAHYKPWEEDDQSEIVKFYADRGVVVSSYGAFGIGEDEEAARKVFRLAEAADFDTVTIGPRPGGLELAEKLCREYGKRVAVHNHGRHDRYGPAWTLEEMLAEQSENVGVCLDTAWMIDAGSDPVEVARKLADRLYSVHLKDFVFDRAGKPSDVIVGDGNLDLPAFLGVLKEIDFSGPLTLEYEGDVDAPVPATKRCAERTRSVLAEMG